MKTVALMAMRAELPRAVHPGDPRSARDWVLGEVRAELARSGSVVPRVVTLRQGHALETALPPGDPGGPTWGSLAARAGVWAAFRVGDGARDGRAAVAVVERLADDRAWWAIRHHLSDVSGFEEGEGPLDAIPFPGAREWFDGFERVAEVSESGPLEPVDDGPSVVLHGVPLRVPAPSDPDGFAELVARFLMADRQAMAHALGNPPCVLTLRGRNLERWELRRPQPAGLDDLVRNLCALGEPPVAAAVLRPGATTVRGERVASLHGSFEAGRRRLEAHLPYGAAPSSVDAPWVGKLVRRVGLADGWIGVAPSVELGLSPQGWAGSGPAAEG